MAARCDHHSGSVVDVDDENLLLDNDGLTWDNCEKCRQRRNLAQNGTAPLQEEHYESPEDSPLLINDCYSTTVQMNGAFHCHTKVAPTDDSQAWQKLVFISTLCFVFMVAELVGGYLAGSLAVMTDAAHLLSDFVAFAVSLVSIWISRWPATHRMTFGYYRAEVLGAFLSVLTVWILAGIFCVLAVLRLWNGDFSIDGDTMLYIASGGVVINILMGAVLHGICQSHSHGPPHNHSHAHNHENINVRAAAAHVLGDLLQSCGVLAAAIIIKLFPTAKAADPACTVLFTVIVVAATVRVAKDSAAMLLEASPAGVEDVSLALRHLPGVRHLHSLHMWSLAPGKDAVAVHLAVDEYCDRDNILNMATGLVRSKASVVSCTIQVELYNAELTNECKQCQFLHS